MKGNLYLDQFIGSLRARGLPQTLRQAWSRLVSEDTAPVPLGERLWLNRHGFKPDSYFVYGFDAIHRTARNAFMSDGANARLGQRNRRFGAALRNKLLFHRVMRLQHGIRAPDLVGFIDDARVLQAAAPHRPVALTDLFHDDDELVFKPVTGSKSSGVLRMHRDAASLDLLQRHRSAHGYIAVRVVRQASYAAAVHAPSTNTIRIVTMRDPDTNEVFVPRAVHRFGVKATGQVDNWAAGGVSCNVDVTDGTLGAGVIHPRFTAWRLDWLERHPDSDSQLLGACVPQWGELLATVGELMNLFPDVTFAAWDMLATDEGWCAIEGNEIMGIHLIQVHGGLFEDPRVARFVAFHTGE